MFAVVVHPPKSIDKNFHVVFYFVDYSRYYHSSINNDVKIDRNGYSVRMACYLTGHMVTWAKYVKSLNKTERVKVLKHCFNI